MYLNQWQETICLIIIMNFQILLREQMPNMHHNYLVNLIQESTLIISNPQILESHLMQLVDYLLCTIFSNNLFILIRATPILASEVEIMLMNLCARQILMLYHMKYNFVHFFQNNVNYHKKFHNYVHSMIYHNNLEKSYTNISIQTMSGNMMNFTAV